MNNYARVADKIRHIVLTMIYKAQTSHISSNFGCIDLLTVLYLNKKPEDEIIISKGWVAATIYALLAETGVIPWKDLKRYCKPKEKKYIGLAEPMEGIKFAGGSMQLGTGAAVGFALAKKLKGEKGKVYVVESDGGINGGIIWESLAIASHHKLDNLVFIVEQNGLQAMGKTEDILNFEPLDEKLKAFGCEVRKVNGHNHEAIERALTFPPLYKGKPIAIIAKTIKGKGVSFFEADNKWHYLHIEKEDYQKALAELNHG